MAELAADFMATNKIPGLSIAIAIKGKPVYVEAFGLADRTTGEAVTPQHRFRIASISKTVTATGIFTLIEAGKLKLDAYVFGPDSVLGADYPTPPSLQSLKQANASRSFNEQITIEHLLTHTSGAWEHGANDPLRKNKDMTHRQLIAWTLEHLPLTTAPGQVFAYSNFGYCILGRVIEKLTGQPYDRYIKDNILKRCGITGMQIAKNARADRAVDEVRYYDIGATYDPYARDVARLDSCGGWIGTPSDLTNFFVHIDGFKDTDQLLSEDTLRVMTTPSAANPRYAKGLFIDRRDEQLHARTRSVDVEYGARRARLESAGGLKRPALVSRMQRCEIAFENAKTRRLFCPTSQARPAKILFFPKDRSYDLKKPARLDKGDVLAIRHRT